MSTKYHEGPLKGCYSADVLLDERTTAWLEHAAQELGRPLDTIIRVAVEEAALDWAKKNGLTQGEPT